MKCLLWGISLAWRLDELLWSVRSSGIYDEESSMPTGGRIRISLASGELEVEGSLEFVDRYEKSIKEMLHRLDEQPAPRKTRDGGGGSSRLAALAGEIADFGEILHGLPRSATGSDQMLVAGWYAQKSATDDAFTTGDGNKLLVGQGIKLSNASQAMRGNLAAKRVFKVAGDRWRVSKQGEEHLKTLLPSE
jgi:hypothetical protein